MTSGVRIAILAGLAAWGCAGCRVERAPDRAGAEALTGPHDGEYLVPGYDDRAWLVHLPPSYDGSKPVPVVIGMHGGGGEKEGFARVTCPEGDADAPTCILQVADREGFAVVMPDGVSQGLRGGRYWNAGGGSKEYRCVGGNACAEGSDDVAYVDALLDEVRRAVYVDDARIYATGLSNGAAMSHRLACERADVFAAVAPVAGANQALAVPGCSPSRPVPVLHLHGSDDPCWGFDGAIETNLCGSLDDGKFMEPEKSHAFWLDANGCDGETTSPVPDASNDGTSTTRHVGRSCDADTELWVVDGGGHAWPGGWPYLGRFFIGTVPQDYSATEAIWTFFAAHPRVP